MNADVTTRLQTAVSPRTRLVMQSANVARTPTTHITMTVIMKAGLIFISVHS